MDGRRHFRVIETDRGDLREDFIRLFRMTGIKTGTGVFHRIVFRTNRREPVKGSQ